MKMLKKWLFLDLVVILYYCYLIVKNDLEFKPKDISKITVENVIEKIKKRNLM